jgi:hypothetical protein
VVKETHQIESHYQEMWFWSGPVVSSDREMEEELEGEEKTEEIKRRLELKDD